MVIRSRLISSTLLGCLFLGLVPLTGIAEIELHTRTMAARDAAAQQEFNLPPVSILRASTFGYNELAADLVWVRTINYFTDQLFRSKEMVHIKKYLDTIIALDSQFKEIYIYGPSMLLSLRGLKYTNREVMSAIEILKQAVEAFPEDWSFPKMLGSYYLFELKGKDTAEKDSFSRQGAEWIRRAALLGAKEPWLTSLAAKVLSQQGQRELAIRHLQEMYMTTQNDKVRQEIRMRLMALKEEQLASDLSQAGNQFVDRFNKSPLNYIPANLFILLDPRQPEAFSLN